MKSVIARDAGKTGKKKKNALEKARSALKKAEHVNTPLSITRKLKKKREKKT